MSHEMSGRLAFRIRDCEPRDPRNRLSASALPDKLTDYQPSRDAGEFTQGSGSRRALARQLDPGDRGADRLTKYAEELEARAVAFALLIQPRG